MFRGLSLMAFFVAFVATMTFFAPQIEAIDDTAVPTESLAVQTIRQQVAAGGPVTIPSGVHVFYSPLVLKQNNTFPTSIVGGGAERGCS